MRAPGAGGGGEGKGGGAAGGSSGEFFWKWVGGRHSQPQVLLVLGAAVSPGRSGLVVPSHRSQTPGWGREEAGAAASHT